MTTEHYNEINSSPVRAGKSTAITKNMGYRVIETIGLFANELAFKKKYTWCISDDKTILEIENTVEPGMPDLLVVDRKDRTVFVEVKYARNGRITFKKTQIPWYRRHRHLKIIIVAYNDKTQNIHEIDASIIIARAESVTFKLEDESRFILESLL